MNAPRHISHDETVVNMLKADPDFADEYLAAALDEADLPSGHAAPYRTSPRHERRS
jgi:hypothetical protein